MFLLFLFSTLIATVIYSIHESKNTHYSYLTYIKAQIASTLMSFISQLCIVYILWHMAAKEETTGHESSSQHLSSQLSSHLSSQSSTGLPRIEDYDEEAEL